MIAILAPYGRNEVTAAAVRLADLIVSVGEEAHLVSLGVHEPRIHSGWDSRVRSSKDAGIYRSVRGASHCIWFGDGGGAAAYRKGSLVADKAIHLGVPQWHALRPCDRSIMTLYNRIICPSLYAADLLSRAFYEVSATTAGPPPNIFVCAWNAGLPFTRHNGLTSIRPRVAVTVDAGALDGHGGKVILNTVFEILSEAECELTLVCSKSWRRQDRARLVELCGLFPHRFAVLYPRSFLEQAALLQSHDLLLLTAVKSDFGMTASRALACGLAVVCHDVSPLTDHVFEGRNGVLVPCLLHNNWLGAPVAVANGPGMARSVLGLLQDRSRLLRLQQNDWYINALTTQFDQFWKNQLGLT